MNIEVIRGDTRCITFTIKTDDNKTYVIEENDKLYFTVKKSFYNKNIVLQKTYGKGITYNGLTKEYEINLCTNDTCNIECGSYVYDIKIIVNADNDEIVETLIKGTLTIDINCTHKENE